MKVQMMQYIIFVLSVCGILNISCLPDDGGQYESRSDTSQDIPVLIRQTPEEVDAVCNCVTNATDHCTRLMELYGSVVIDGVCLLGSSAKRRRKDITQDRFRAHSVPMFFAERSCTSMKPLVLYSSGTSRRLKLSSSTSVVVCRDSISQHLQHLTISDVDSVTVTSRALKSSKSNSIVVHFKDIRELLHIAEEAFKIELNVMKPDYTRGGPNEYDNSHSPPVVLEILVDTADEVRLKQHSIIAPRVVLNIKKASNVTIDSQSIIPYAYPESSSLIMSQCEDVMIGSQAMTVGRFDVLHVKQLHLSTCAIEVIAGGESNKMRMEHIATATLLEDALSLAPGVTININNVTIASAGRRALHSTYETGAGNLHHAIFTDVQGSNLSSIAICIAAEAVVLYNMDLQTESDRTVACIEGNTVHPEGRLQQVHICTTHTRSSVLCNDTKCAPCHVPYAEHLVSDGGVTSEEITVTDFENETTVWDTLSTEIPFSHLISTKQENIIPVQQYLPSTTTTTTVTDIGTRKPSIMPDSRETGSGLHLHSLYLLLIVIATIILVMVVTACTIHRYRTRGTKGKYRLPREQRITTFKNQGAAAHVIATPETLANFHNSQQPHCSINI